MQNSTNTLLGTNICLTQGMFEDDSPSPHVGCVCSLEVISTLLEAGNYKHITEQTHPQKMSPSFSRNRGFSKEI